MRVLLYGLYAYTFATLLIVWRFCMSFSKGLIGFVELVADDYDMAKTKTQKYAAKIKKSETMLEQIDLEQEMNK